MRTKKSKRIGKIFFKRGGSSKGGGGGGGSAPDDEVRTIDENPDFYDVLDDTENIRRELGMDQKEFQSHLESAMKANNIDFFNNNDFNSIITRKKAVSFMRSLAQKTGYKLIKSKTLNHYSFYD